MGRGRAVPVVGVPAPLTRLPTTTSVGRIWTLGLASLARHVNVRAVDDVHRPGRLRRRVDVWLSDGHQGPLDVTAPVVAVLHEAVWSDPELRELMEPQFLELHEGPSAMAAVAAARILTCSQSSKSQIVGAYGVPPDRVHVFPYGLDHTIYRPGLPPPTDLLERAGGSAGFPYVLFVSTVHPRKNLGALRDALAQLAGEGLPHALVLVGGRAADRHDSVELMREAVAPIPGIDQPPVNLAGASDADVARLMANAAAFCLPSLMEGFGMAVAEAMACGAAVVVSDRGSLPEVVGDAGVVTTTEAASLAAGLREVLSSPGRREELGRAAARRAAAYTWDAMAAGWAEVLALAIESRQRNGSRG
jgi:glycosyltransferase involved in cell wall biosynthesis